MGNAAMLGLLEGFGNGMQTMGNTIMVNALQEAEERRRMSLENVRREYAREE